MGVRVGARDGVWEPGRGSWEEKRDETGQVDEDGTVNSRVTAGAGVQRSAAFETCPRVAGT